MEVESEEGRLGFFIHGLASGPFKKRFLAVDAERNIADFATIYSSPFVFPVGGGLGEEVQVRVVREGI